MSDAMDSDVREVIRRRIALRVRNGHERLLLNHEALRALLDAADERDRLQNEVDSLSKAVRSCRECCTSGADIRYQTEDCAYGHDHRDMYCPTIAALDGDEQ